MGGEGAGPSDPSGGAEHKEVAFALALILDELARHLRGVDDTLRQQIAELCHALLRRAEQ